jgi:hypothetical protein
MDIAANKAWLWGKGPMSVLGREKRVTGLRLRTQQGRLLTEHGHLVGEFFLGEGQQVPPVWPSGGGDAREEEREA